MHSWYMVMRTLIHLAKSCPPKGGSPKKRGGEPSRFSVGQMDTQVTMAFDGHETCDSKITRSRCRMHIYSVQQGHAPATTRYLVKSITMSSIVPGEGSFTRALDQSVGYGVVSEL